MIRIFSHYIPGKKLILVGVETLILLISIFLVVDFGFSHADRGIATSAVPSLLQAAVFAFCILTSMAAMGLYEQESSESVRETLLRMGVAFALGVAAMSAVFYLAPSLYVGRGVLAMTIVVALGGSVLTRLAFLKWVTPGVFQARVLVLGTGSRAASVGEVARQKRVRGNIKVVGYLPLQATQHHVKRDQILPAEESLLSAAKKYQVNEIVIAVRDRRGGGLPVQQLLECKLMGIKITELSAFFERERCQLHLESLNVSWMVFGEGFRQGFLRETMKRLFDVVSSAALALVTLPVMLITALCIYLEDRSPILYRQERVGQGGRVFTILKFRSMRNDAEVDGKPRWANADDDRTTRVGRVIRKLRIDELPQIFNVLKGDMSFVGPRPERPFFVEQLASKIPYYNARHSIKPGITGWAQVSYAYGASLDDAVEKLQYDLYYVKNHTLFLDLMILIDTIQVVLWGKGAR